MQPKSKWIGIVTGMTLLLTCGSLVAAPPGTTTRPIQDFLSRQGTFCVDHPLDPLCSANPDPGVPRFQLWDNSCIGPELAFASVDYAGLAAAYI
ncbi:MAG TPA: hypothetical protein VGQ71_04665 [Terriglobales bacterium]|jgi:hypothetical protein|nr:hypothetical protein [Terriglobales bacterium]